MNVAPALTYESYKENLPIMIAAIRKVANAIGGDLDEMLADTYFLFQKAVESFNPTAGRKFSSWLFKVCWDDTFSARRVQCNRKAKHPTHFMSEKFDMEDRVHFDFDTFLSDLSADARQAVLFCLEPPATVKITNEGIPKRSSMVAAMRQQFAWTTEQIDQIAQEIRELL